MRGLLVEADAVSDGQVRLSADEAMAAAVVGILQQLRAMRDTSLTYRNNRSGRENRTQRQKFGDAIMSQMAELAACKHMQVPWMPSRGGVRGADTIRGIEIRSTCHAHGKLAIYDRDIADKPGAPFFLVTGEWPLFHVRGWLRAHDAEVMGERIPDKIGAGYWISQDRLRPMAELPELQQ